MAAATIKGERVPRLEPRRLFFGNALEIMGETPLQNLMKITEKTGDIYEIDIAGHKRIMVSSQALVHELSDQSRFKKSIHLPLQKLRPLAADGLFTAENEEPNWQKAHNILMPAFSLQAMQNYIPYMYDIAEQLIQRWERFDDDINVAEQMTNLTFDTIGLAGFNMRFNSFYRETPHPFVQSLMYTLTEAMNRSSRPDFITKFMTRRNRLFEEHLVKQNALVDRIVQERMAAGGNGNPTDLLGLMLSGIDKKTQGKLDPVNIRYQVITFLAAGHETTSGLLSFTIYYLLKNPAVMERAVEEADRVLGGGDSIPTLKQINNLTYITQVLKEALRIWPTAPAYAVHPVEDTVIGGRYFVDKAMSIMVLLPCLHRDKRVWGEDAASFDPDRFLPANEKQRQAEFPDAYKPFGNGERACIGRQFAMTEAALVTGLILKNFRLEDPYAYRLQIKETLTLKPKNFIIRAKKRSTNGRALPRQPVVEKTAEKMEGVKKHGTTLLVLYGSNLGTAEDLANKLAGEADYRGFETATGSLDAYKDKLPVTGAVAFVVSTYNGTPTDNSVEFCRMLESTGLADDAFKNVKYAVFGCGNTDWETFQAVPRLIAAGLEKHGGKQLLPLAEGDANFDLHGTFDSWMEEMWGQLAGEFAIDLNPGENGKKDFYVLEQPAARPPDLVAGNFQARELQVVENRVLYSLPAAGGNAEQRAAHHLEIALPAGVTYMTGDYLGVIPENKPETIRRIRELFRLNGSDQVILKQQRKGKSLLPVDTLLTIDNLLSANAELEEVITRNQIKLLLNYTSCPFTKGELEKLTGKEEKSREDYKIRILDKHITILDFLENFPAITLPFPVFLEQLPPLKPRYYSISSSAAEQPHQISITVAVRQEKSLSGQGIFTGTASSYLSKKKGGSTITAFIQPNKTFFRLPADPGLPLLFIGAGTGIAPFRGFLRERAFRKDCGNVLVFYGCRSQDQDFLYKEEFAEWEQGRICSLYPAFSRPGNGNKKYVQDLIREKSIAVWEAVEQGGIVYICGSASTIAPAVRHAFLEIYREKTGGTEAAGEAWLSGLILEQRYRSDIWTSR